MFNRGRKPAEGRKKHDLSQFGIFDVPDLENPDDDSAGDSDYEAELAAMTAGDEKREKKRKPKVIPQSDLDKMVAESLRDIGSDEELSADDDDPDLLNELSEIAGTNDDEESTNLGEQVLPGEVEISKSPEQNVSEPILPTTTLSTVDVIKSRIEMYKIAEKNAIEQDDKSRARSRARGIKTLETMLKDALKGKTINPDEIPPVVSIKAPNAPNDTPVAEPNSQPIPENVPENTMPPQSNLTPSSPVKAETTGTNVDVQKINALLSRQREYKVAALTAKKSGDTATALQYVKVIKIFDTVIASARNGDAVDLSDMPPPPSELSSDLLKAIGQTESPAAPAQPPKHEDSIQKSTEDKDNEPDSKPKPQPAVLSPPDAPKTILEALNQRLQKYQSVEANAKAEGNDRKARQNGRIVQQYLDAIRAHKAGRAVNFEELPSPPGYPPIPTSDQPARAAQPAARKIPAEPTAPASSSDVSPKRSPIKRPDSRVSGNHSSTTIMNKTIELLLERQKEFREAAIEAKKAGELEEAKEFLKTFKGIESLLNVARGGLPVDLSTIPISPKQREKLNDTFEMLSDEEENPNNSDDVKDIYNRLEEHLTKQLEKCKAWSVHHRALGDVAGTNRFENLAIQVQHDLDLIKLAHRKGRKVPKIRFEQKTFNIVQCNTDLAESELEIQVIRGIGYNVSKPKDVDTYVKVEFPYPQDTPYRNKTAVIYDTDNPDYNEKFVAEIQPKARLCQRIFKRHSVKFEIYVKGGFLRSDTLIGTVSVKLQPLENTCEIHDSFDIINGRKPVGGKLEVKVRIRNPILSKQVVTEKEKWVAVDLPH